MRNYLKNKMKDRLAYCMEWKNSVDIYLANKEITKKADIEYYRSRPILKLILDIYFIPTNFVNLLKYLRMLHEYNNNQIEIPFSNKLYLTFVKVKGFNGKKFKI